MAVNKLIIFVVFICLSSATVVAAAQGPVRGKLEPERDRTMEISSKHNLEVARWSISKRKAYKGGLDRLQEILDTHPQFSRMDEVYYWMGEAYVKLNETAKAQEAFNKVLKEYPESEFVKKSKEQLDKIKQGVGSRE